MRKKWIRDTFFIFFNTFYTKNLFFSEKVGNYTTGQGTLPASPI